MKDVETTAAWRRMGDFFLLVCVPVFHAVGGFFIMQFVLSGEYTWGRTLRIFVVVLGNLIMGYEFVYRDLQTTHQDWSGALLRRSVMRYSVIPFAVGIAAFLILWVIRSMGR